MPRSKQTRTKPLNLALQGGGSHGALTWGVLDRLLEDDRLAIRAISGTSAGAMNAVALADGMARGGRDGARDSLHALWKAVSESARFSPVQRSPLDRLTGNYSLDQSPGYLFLESMSRMFSPYELNPLGINPLRGLLADLIDFDAVNGLTDLSVHVTATNVRTGKPKVFRRDEITVDALLASACLPTMFQAVEIDGEAYWDGGYAGNPTITPLVRESNATDTILVQINPRERSDVPRTAADILNRVNEISFNSPLMKEIRMIALLRQVVDPGTGEGARWARMRTHRIMTEKLAALGASSKLNAEWEFIEMLHAEGRNAADQFIAEHGDDVGKRSSADIDVLLAES